MILLLSEKNHHTKNCSHRKAPNRWKIAKTIWSAEKTHNRWQPTGAHKKDTKINLFFFFAQPGFWCVSWLYKSQESNDANLSNLCALPLHQRGEWKCSQGFSQSSREAAAEKILFGHYWRHIFPSSSEAIFWINTHCFHSRICEGRFCWLLIRPNEAEWNSVITETMATNTEKRGFLSIPATSYYLFFPHFSRRRRSYRHPTNFFSVFGFPARRQKKKYTMQAKRERLWHKRLYTA